MWSLGGKTHTYKQKMKHRHTVTNLINNNSKCEIKIDMRKEFKKEKGFLRISK